MLLRHLYLTTGSKQPVIQDFIVAPTPRITTVPPRIIGLDVGGQGVGTNKNVYVSANDKHAHVSRSVLYSSFVRKDNKRARIWLDFEVTASGTPAYLDNIKTLAGHPVEYAIIHIDDRDCCEWRLILRKARD